MTKIVTTRKEHNCESCDQPIKIGVKAKTISRKYQRSSGSGSYWETYYFHIDCPIKEPGEI